MDLTSFQTALGLATTVIGATGQAASTVEKIKGLFSSDKVPENSEVQKLLNDLAKDLTAANMMNVQLSEALKLVSAELKRQDDFETTKARYEVFQTSEGAIVLKLKADMTNGEPQHYICPTCLNKDKLVAYLARRHNGFMACQNNDHHTFRFFHSPPPQVNRHTSDLW